jgi:hypothetical protein
MKRRPQGGDENQVERTDTPVAFDAASPEAFLSELKTQAENESKRGELTGYLPHLNSLLDSTHALQSLEVLFLMALDGSNLPKMAAEEGILEKLDTLKTLGQLKQKRLASTTYDKLKVGDFSNLHSPIAAIRCQQRAVERYHEYLRRLIFNFDENTFRSKG